MVNLKGLPLCPLTILCIHWCQGNVKLQVMAIFTATENGSTALALRQSEIFASLLAEYPNDCTLVHDINTLNQIAASSKLGMIAAIENASGFCEEDEPLKIGFERLERIITNTKRILYISFTHHAENRFGGGTMKTKDRLKVVQSNLAIVGMAAILIYFVGWQNYLIAQLTILYISSSAGIWLFYVQHQYEDVIWTRKEDWDHTKLSLYGSSFFKLPRLFQWFSGNIGFHHIHHLSPKIPNYNLESCHYENDVFQEIKPLTFLSSFKTWKLRLWDEEKQRLVGFSALKEA